MSTEVVPCGHPVVDAVEDMGLTGNLVPKGWFHHITFERRAEGERKPRPDLCAITVLSEIVFWHRPTLRTVLDKTGKKWLQTRRKRFAADLLQLGRHHFQETFNLSKREVSRSLQRLEKLGVVKRVFRTINHKGRRLNNVMFIELVPGRLAELSVTPESEQKGAVATDDHSSCQEGNSPCQEGPELLPGMPTPVASDDHSPCQDGKTYTESTQEIPSKIPEEKSTTKKGEAAPRGSSSCFPNLGAATGKADSLICFYQAYYPMKFGVEPKAVTGEEKEACVLLMKGNLSASAAALVLVAVWDKIGQVAPTNGYQYLNCKKARALGYFCENFEKVITEADAEDILSLDFEQVADDLEEATGFHWEELVAWFPELGDEVDDQHYPELQQELPEPEKTSRYELERIEAYVDRGMRRFKENPRRTAELRKRIREVWEKKLLAHYNAVNNELAAKYFEFREQLERGQQQGQGK